MLTYTHTINDALDLHSYSLVGDCIDFDDTIIYVGEHTSRVQSIIKSIEYYVDNFNAVVQYKTVVE